MNSAGLFGLTWTWAMAQGALEILHPWVLLLLPLPLAAWRWLPPYHERVEALHVPFFAPVAKITGEVPAPGAVVLRRGLAEKLLLPLAWALVVLAAAGPQWVDPPIERIESGRDLLLAVDLSQSMEERDFPDPAGKRIERMAAVKQVLGDFVARRKGDRIGLVVFGSGAFVESTFTLDHDLVRAQIDAARPGLAGRRTAIGDAIGLGVKLFDEQKTKHKVMILVTDGNDTASRMPPEKAAEIAARAASPCTPWRSAIRRRAARTRSTCRRSSRSPRRRAAGSSWAPTSVRWRPSTPSSTRSKSRISRRCRPAEAAAVPVAAGRGPAAAVRTARRERHGRASRGAGSAMPDLAALADFHFLRPSWLAGLVAVVLLHVAQGYWLAAERPYRGVVAHTCCRTCW